MSKKTKDNSDRLLTNQERGEIQECIEYGYSHLKMKPGAETPDSVQEAIRRSVDRVLLAKKKPKQKELDDVALGLGCLWGQTVCDALGWQWCAATLEGDEVFVIASPDRSHVFMPMQFIRQQLAKSPPEDNTSLLAYNMLKAGRYGVAEPGSYTLLG